MEIGLRYLGFVIPTRITMSQTPYLNRPGPGVCAECNVSRTTVYVRGDGTCYCDRCIEFDLAEAQPHPAQGPIAPSPREKVLAANEDGLDEKLKPYKRAFSL